MREQLPAPVAERIDRIKERLGEIVRGARRWNEVWADLDFELNAALVGAVEAAEGLADDEPAGEPVELGMVVAANVRALRREAGWTQASVAGAMADVGFAWRRITVAEVESGGRRLQLEEMFGLAGLYGVPVTTLLLPGPEPVAWFDRTLPAAQVVELVLGRAGMGGGGGPDWLPGLLVSGRQSGRPAHDLWRSAQVRLARKEGR